MRVAVVVPRYGADIGGGAESQARGFAQEAARRGWTVEAWTTCAHSHYTWENKYPAGESRDGAVRVHRFPVQLERLERQQAIEWALGTRYHVPRADQYAWLEGGAQSPKLYAHIQRHAPDFDAVVVLPYAMPLTNMAAWAAPDRVILWPCLHDEPYAYLEPVRLLLESVRGVMFNSPEEGDLARRQIRIAPRRATVLGEGVTLDPPPAPAPVAPRDLLFIGRLEPGKNLSLLYSYVQRYAEEGGNLRLIVGGRGPYLPPTHPAFDYRGFISDAQKSALYASSLALCQPSLFESFSLVIMESWLAGRPVLVHRDCPVTRGHVQRSRGGLWFSHYEEFVGTIEWLQSNPTLAARMGQNGGGYVRRNYTWPAVVTRFEETLRHWQ